MAKAKAPSVPDVHTLRRLMEEYLEMLREAENGVRQSLRLDPENEKFWDELAELHPRLTTLEARSNSLQEEIEDLMAKLPED